MNDIAPTAPGSPLALTTPEPGVRPYDRKRLTGRPPRRFRRKLVGVVMALTAISGVGIAGAGAASADPGIPLTIQNGDLTWTYLGQYWYWYESYGEWHLADAYAPPYGGGRLYCWAGTLSCWFETFPPFGSSTAWIY